MLSAALREKHTLQTATATLHTESREQGRTERLNCPHVQKNALLEVLRMRCPPSAEVTAARAPGWLVEDSHPGEYTLGFMGHL